MMQLLEEAKVITPSTYTAIQNVYFSCDICVSSSGRPNANIKVLVSNINQGFNQEIQADYVAVYVSNKKYEDLKITDMETTHGEISIVISRDDKNMNSSLEK